MAIYKVINSKRGMSTHGAMRNCLRYVLSPSKTEDTISYVIGPYESTAFDYDSVYRSFLQNKEAWNKDRGRMYIHSVLSFPKNEQITPEQALDFAIRFAGKTYSGYQCAIAVHTDKEHIHCHMVTNTVSFVDGRKLQKSQKDLQADKDYCNALCEEYRLSIAEKGKHADGTPIAPGEIISWDKDKYHLLTDSTKPSFLADCGIAVLHSLESSTCKGDFILAMASHGWAVEWNDNRKHIVFINEQGKKVRGSNLQKSFSIDATKEGLQREFDAARARTEEAEQARADAGKRNRPSSGAYTNTHRAAKGRGIYLCSNS